MARPLELLYLAYRLPYPPDKGERIRAFHQIRYLARDCRIHLVCTDAASQRELVAGVAPFCRSVMFVPSSLPGQLAREATGFLTGRPRMAGSFVSRRLRQAVTDVVRNQPVDMVLVSTLLAAEAVRGLDLPIAIDLIDAYSALWRDMAGGRRGLLAQITTVEAARLERYEARLLAEFDRSVVVSDAEATVLRRQNPHARITVVGNGVDVDHFRPAERAASIPPTIVFTGTMNYFPNADAVRYFHREVWPIVRVAHPSLRLVIVGRNPTRAVRRLANDEGVEVTGWVPDVRPYLDRAWAAVAPFRVARGVQNKVLEAMAAGVPVVASSVAVQGLRPEARDVLRIGDDPEEFARELLALFENEGWRRNRARAGREYVERFHRWDDAGALLLDTLREVVDENQRPEGLERRRGA